MAARNTVWLAAALAAALMAGVLFLLMVQAFSATQRGDFLAYIQEREQNAAACATVVPSSSLSAYGGYSSLAYCRSEYDRWRRGG